MKKQHLLGILVLDFSTAGTLSGLDCIAHRGFSSNVAENSLESIEEAWKVDAHIAEVDVWLLADGELVLFHDRKVGGRKVSDLDYSSLQSLVPDWHVPTLADAMAAIPADKGILLDLKSTGEYTLAGISKQFSNELPECRVIIQSSDLEALKFLAADLPPEVSYQYLTKLRRRGLFRRPPDAEDLARLLVDAKIDGVSAKGRRFIDRSFVETLRAEGLRYYAWTINDPDRISHYAGLGADGIITDYPTLFHEALGNGPNPSAPPPPDAPRQAYDNSTSYRK